VTRAFISYNHQDEQYRVELDKHLALLKREGIVDVWSDHCIRPGEAFDPAIAAALEQSDVILLLVSADFMHSDYCSTVELARAMERRDEGDAIVVPIILRPCDWKSAPFGRLKALPTDGRPVTRWPTLDDAFLGIVEQLQAMLMAELQRNVPAAISGSATSAARATSPSAARMPRSSNLNLPRRFTDEDRHDFVVATFAYVKSYFESSLEELQKRNPGYTFRMSEASPTSFNAIVFGNGQRAAGCRVRIGAPFGGSGIAYSADVSAGDNSYNEYLSVESDQHLLFFKAGMAMFNRGDEKARLTEEGAAEHL
jgi:hypothetical protein